jgi:aldose 1-epimerase
MERFEKNLNDKEVKAVTIADEQVKAVITNYGARIVQLWIKDKEGRDVNVVFGYNSIDEYLNTNEVYHGAVIGRYANRIAKGRFSIHGKKYQLVCNNGVNHLHGGPDGFHQQVWEIVSVKPTEVVLSHLSPDGHEGYPGDVQVTVTYRIENRGLTIHYKAETNRETVFNITNHAYFNLNGVGNGNVLDHELQIQASRFTPVDYTLIPTGELMPVELTPFDFRKGMKIGDWITDAHPQIRIGNGYDHNFCFDDADGSLRKSAVALGDRSGIQMEVWTTEPGVQFYVNGERSLFCLETQHYPDSPNQSSFPSVALLPGQPFSSTTAYRFG